LTSTFAIAVEAWICHLIFFAIHELISVVIAFMSPQEKEVTPTSAVAAEFPCGAVYLLMAGVVA